VQELLLLAWRPLSPFQQRQHFQVEELVGGTAWSWLNHPLEDRQAPLGEDGLSDVAENLETMLIVPVMQELLQAVAVATCWQRVCLKEGASDEFAPPPRSGSCSRSGRASSIRLYYHPERCHDLMTSY
jgi:hypothetical protein